MGERLAKQSCKIGAPSNLKEMLLALARLMREANAVLSAGSASLWAEELEQCKTVALGKQEQTMMCQGRICPLALFCHCPSTSARPFRSNSGDKSLREARSSRKRDQLRPGSLKAGCRTGHCRASVSSLAALEAFSPCWLLSVLRFLSQRSNHCLHVLKVRKISKENKTQPFTMQRSHATPLLPGNSKQGHLPP